MKNALIKRPEGVPAGSALAKSENELYSALQSQFESFFSQGVILNRINIEKEFKVAGFESFADYMNERQPCGIQERQAWRLIAAMKLRPNLPTLSPGDSVGVWTEKAIRPLLHKDFAPKDQERLGKKIATAVKKGTKPTAALVKDICDKDRDVDGIKDKKKAAELSSALTPYGLLKKYRTDVAVLINNLKELPSGFWTAAEEEKAGCRKQFAETASELVSLLLETKSRRHL